MQLGDLIELARERLADYTEPYLASDKSLIFHLNQAVFEAARRSLLIYDETTSADGALDLCDIAILPGQRAYKLHPRILSVVSATLGSTKMTLGRDPTLPQLDQYQPLWRNLTGVATGFATFRRVLYLNRTPDLADTLHIRVYRLPLNSEKMARLTDEPPIPEEFQPDLAYWATHKIFDRKDSDLFSEADAQKDLAVFEARFGKAPSARNFNASEDAPHDSQAHARPFGGVVGRSTWFGHRWY